MSHRVDSHCHVFAHQGVRPPAPVGGAAYAPPPVDVAEHAAQLAALGCDRGVLVQPSAYGTDDHGVLLAALRARPDHLRGVACVPADAPRALLTELHAAGVRGTRVQDGYAGGVPVDAMPRVGEAVADLGWHVEVWTDLRRWVDRFAGLVEQTPVPVVVDHLGYVPSDEGLDSPAIALLLDLAASGRCWVTLSGLDRLYPASEPQDPADPAFAAAWARHEDRVAERVAALVAVAPEQLLWGSDWPHVGLRHRHPTATDQRARIERWLPDAAVRRLVLETNPARRYDFGGAR